MRMKSAWAKLAVAVAVAAGMCAGAARGETVRFWDPSMWLVDGIQYDYVCDGHELYEGPDPIQDGVVAVGGCTNTVCIANIPSHVSLRVICKDYDTFEEWEETINCRVTEIHAGAFRNNIALESVTIPASVESWWGWNTSRQPARGSVFYGCTSLTEVNLPDGLRTICPSMFFGCTALPSVTIPASVETLERSAFNGCTSLTEVNLPDGVKSIGNNAFAGCTALPSVTIPASVETLEYAAFSNCTSLIEVKLADGLKNIGTNVFYRCTALPTVTIPASVEVWGKNVFADCTGLVNVTLSAGLQTVGATVFSGCSGLTNVVFGAGLESVGDRAFYNCYRLPKVVFPESMREIGSSAFSGCTALASVELGGTETIGDKAFEGCTGLKAVSFPAGVRRIGAGAFSGCTGLATVALPSGVEEVDAGAFSGASVKSLYFDNAAGGLLDAFSKESLRTLYLGADARGITGERLGDCLSLSALLVAKGNPEYAVDGAGALYDKDFTRLIKYPAGAAAASYTVPATVRTVDAKAFAHATALREVVFQGPVTEIGEDAFDWCIALERVVFPSGAGTVGAGAFRVCPSLETLRFEGTGLYSVPTFGEGQFLYAKPVVQFDESETSRWISTLSSLGLSYEWIVDADATSTTPVPVPKSWIQSKAGNILSACGGDYEAAAMALASNGVSKVWECYLQGVDPEDGNDRFQLLSKVEGREISMWWEPDLGAERKYAVEGVENMGDAWGETNAGTRFYRARVEMP